VAVSNALALRWIKAHYGKVFDFATLGLPDDGQVEIAKMSGVLAIEMALCAGIAITLAVGWKRIRFTLAPGLQAAVSGALLASINTASEYGFGGVVASLPGFATVKNLLGNSFSDPLLNEAVSVNALAGITGSASGGLSLALSALGKQYQEAAASSGIDPQVLHRVASMASGGMDTLPHNGAVITLLLVSGLTHRESYRDIFAITALKTIAVFFVIALYRVTGLF
jgi:H+/gluconate symporter-like permease